MTASPQPTPYADVNAVLCYFQSEISSVFGGHFQGMYVIGSLALGDFDPLTSDIDFVVVTDSILDDEQFRALRALHNRFAAGDSPFAARLEAVYVTPAALRQVAPTAEQYPQVEKGTALFKAPLEMGWVFQLYTLRQHALIVSGGDLRGLIPPIEREDMRPAVVAIAGMWAREARDDPSWLDWARQRPNQVFIVQTLCRMRYSLWVGGVASKPAALQWGAARLPERWRTLIASTLERQHEKANISEDELNETVAFITDTHDHAGRHIANRR